MPYPSRTFHIARIDAGHGNANAPEIGSGIPPATGTSRAVPSFRTMLPSFIFLGTSAHIPMSNLNPTRAVIPCPWEV